MLCIDDIHAFGMIEYADTSLLKIYNALCKVKQDHITKAVRCYISFFSFRLKNNRFCDTIFLQ